MNRMHGSTYTSAHAKGRFNQLPKKTRKEKEKEKNRKKEERKRDENLMFLAMSLPGFAFFRGGGGV